MTDPSGEIDHLHRRIAELEGEMARLLEEREVREVELAALRADLSLKVDYLATLEKIPEEVVAPKDVHIRNLEAMITQLREALYAARPSERRGLVHRLAGRLRRTAASRAT